MIEFTVQGSEQKISVAIYGYENDQAEDVSDANWLNCKISIRVDPFSFEFNASLTTQDISCFYDDLNRILDTLDGDISFQTDEEWIEIKIEAGSLGGFLVSGIVRPSSYRAKTTLTFKFETDQSYLLGTINDLKQMLKKYPVKT